MYRYRGTDPRHRDNHGLREAMRLRVPLAYFFGVVKGQYIPVFEVFIVGDDPTQLQFRVAFEDRALVGLPTFGVMPTGRPLLAWCDAWSHVASCSKRRTSCRTPTSDRCRWCATASRSASADFLAERYEWFQRAG